MEKIYGYKQQDLIGLAQMIKGNKKNLSKVFEAYSAQTGKAKGSVRNLYYALVKLSQIDAEFTKKYLDGKPIVANKIVQFNKDEEDWLIQKIVEKQKEGQSVRSAIIQLANGDVKLALRFQNKYRSALKQGKIEEIRLGEHFNKAQLQNQAVKIDEEHFVRLKKEIDNLVNKISQKVRKENSYLKVRISFLEAENARLNNILYGNSGVKVVEYFNPPQAQTPFMN